MAFQMMFAVITVALISGAFADRIKFGGWVLFAFGWATLVYFPVAHWVWGGGLIGAKSARWTSPAARWCTSTPVRRRSPLAPGARQAARRPRESMPPHNLPFSRSAPVCCGSAGSASTPAPSCGRPVPRSGLHQHPARHAAAVLGWIAVEWSRTASRPWSVPPPVRSRAWSPSPRPVASSPHGGGPARHRRRCGLRARDQPEVQARLRRLARRGRRALRRRLDRLAGLGFFATNSVNAAITDWSAPATACSTAAASPSSGARPSAGLIVTAWSFVSPGLAFADRQDRRLPGQRRGRGRGHRHRRARRERVRPPGSRRLRWRRRVRDGRDRPAASLPERLRQGRRQRKVAG